MESQKKEQPTPVNENLSEDHLSNITEKNNNDESTSEIIISGPILQFYTKGEGDFESRFQKMVERITTWSESLPPGKVRCHYNMSLELSEFLIAGESFKTSGLPWCSTGITLSLTNTQLSINGEPTDQIDEVIRLQMEWVKSTQVEEKIDEWGTSDSNDKIESEETEDIYSDGEIIEIPIRAVYDPWALWQDKPTPKDAPYIKSDTQLFGATWPKVGKIILAASQRGRSHAHEGKFRDDHFCVKIGEYDQWHFFAVADGAGSAIYSREGSKIACEKFIEILSQNFSKPDLAKKIDSVLLEEIKKNSKKNEIIDHSKTIEWEGFAQCIYSAVYEVWNSIKKTAESAKEHKIQDYSTTLLGLALRRFKKKWVAISYWIGDGGMAFWRPNGTETVLPLGTPDSGEFAGQTRFVTMVDEIKPEKTKQRVRITILDDFDALILMTDGLTDPFFPAEINLSDTKYWSKFWGEIIPEYFPGVNNESSSVSERAESLLKGLSFKIKGNHDDRTLLLITNGNSKKKWGLF